LKLINYYDNMKLLFENSYFNNTVVKKSASALNSPDKHRAHRIRRLLFAFLSGLAYDLGSKGFISSLEGLGTGARQ
jgi:hypothetical protein